MFKGNYQLGYQTCDDFIVDRPETGLDFARELMDNVDTTKTFWIGFLHRIRVADGRM